MRHIRVNEGKNNVFVRFSFSRFVVGGRLLKIFLTLNSGVRKRITFFLFALLGLYVYMKKFLFRYNHCFD